MYHYRDNIEVVTKHIDDSAKKAASDDYSENIVRDMLLATADGIKIDMNPAAIIVNVTLVSPETKTPETKTPEAKTPEATSTQSHIIPPVDYMIPTGSIPLPPDPVWEKQKKKMKRNFDRIAVLSFVIATVLVICFSLAARKDNAKSESALQTMTTDTIHEKAPELPDLSDKSLE